MINSVKVSGQTTAWLGCTTSVALNRCHVQSFITAAAR
jgi:hypothetical protein